MALHWTPQERTRIEEGIIRYPATSNHCAALARIIHGLAAPKHENTRGIQLSGANGEPWLILKRGEPRKWATHTLVEAAQHNADALTGADGCLSMQYLDTYFHHPKDIQVQTVDVFTVDTWIEEEEMEET
jgi:hypothetical protein